MWNNFYRTPTEHWQKTSDFPKGKKLPTYLCREREKKTETKEYGQDLHQCEGAVKEERFPQTRKPLCGWRQRVAEGGSFRATEESAATGVQRAKQRERSPHRGSVPTSTHQPKRLVCSPAGTGGGLELRLRLRRSDPRERTGVGCVNTAWRGLVHHS